ETERTQRKDYHQLFSAQGRDLGTSQPFCNPMPGFPSKENPDGGLGTTSLNGGLINEKELSKGIFNLTPTPLSDEEINLLSRGLKFAPNRRANNFELYIDLKKFIRSLTIKRHFLLHPPEIKTGGEGIDVDYRFRPKSHFFPTHSKGPFLETFEHLVDQQFQNMMKGTNRNKKNCFPNLNKKEENTLKRLIERDDVIIREADKGGGIVLMTTTYYLQEAAHILGDKDTYSVLKCDPTSRFNVELQTILNRAKERGTISQKNYDFLYQKTPIIPIFYFLPKTHKRLPNPPGRPIISGINSLTANLSAYVDSRLQKYAQGAPSYVKDTKSFLQEVENIEWDPEYSWATLDVTSLYS
ncbi:Hypothetical predicted protein, partial [Pelobates cultripes]